MTKKLKLIILLLCALSALSLLLIPSFADEPIGTIPPYPTHMTIMKGVSCKTTYIEGELFSTENLYGRVYFSDGTNEFLMTDKLEYLEKDPLTRDITSITFIYKDESTVYPAVTYSLPITVIPSLFPAPVPVSLTVTSTKAEYLESEKINPSTFNATVVFSDGTQEAINISDCSFSPALDTPLTPEVSSITVSYQSGDTTVSETIPVTVKPIVHLEAWGLEGISVYESAPLEDLPGVTLTAYYDEAKTISSIITDFTIRPAFGTITPDPSGKSKIIITAGSKSIEAEVNVSAIVSYKVSGFNDAYYYGDVCSLENVKVHAVYSDGASIDVTDQVIFNVPETIVAGSTITASHNGYDLKDFIKVLLPEGELMIIMQPTKVHYEIGETFDSTGLSVGVNYSDGTRKFLTSDDYTIEVSSILTAADKFVTLSYYGISTNVSISVGDEAYIVSLSIIGSPDTLTYFEGNLLNTSGLLIQATFSDGTFSIIDHRTLTFTPALDQPLTVDDTSVKISANDGTDKYCRICC